MLLLTDEDDFNALAAAGLAGAADGPVYRLGARLPSHGVVTPYTGGEILFGTSLTRYHIGRRYAAGARIFTRPADSRIPAGSDLLFLVRASGILAPVTRPPYLLGCARASRVRAREVRRCRAWPIAPCSWYGLGGVAPGTAGA